MKRIIFFVNSIVIVFISCNNNSIQIPTIKLNPVQSVSQFRDSVFLSGIRSIYFDNNTYYLTDYERNKIFVLNKDFELLKFFGEEGKGPRELLGASQIYVNEDSIYVYNDSKDALELFNNGNHIKTINLPYDINFNGDTRFFIRDHLIFMSNPNESSSISCFSIDGILLKNFGDIKKYQTDKETIINNFKHVCFYNDNILAVSDCNPNIEMYKMNGEKIAEYDFSCLPMVKKLMKFTGRQSLSSNSYYVIISDIYIFKNKLFLLTLSVNKKNKIEANKILQFEIKEQTLEPTKILDLGKGWYSPICVSQDYIIAFNQTTSELTKYNLP
jgi:hypothetical protein